MDMQRLIISVFHVCHIRDFPITMWGAKWILTIKVIWLSFAHHWASIYISSYICFECHWAVPWNSTLNPIGNVHYSFLLPAMLTIPEMSSLISLCYRLPHHYSPLFNQVEAGIHLFFKIFHCILLPVFLYCLLSSMQWINVPLLCKIMCLNCNAFIIIHNVHLHSLLPLLRLRPLCCSV